MISVVGIGPGDSQYLTAAAKALIDDADYLAGWPRALSAFAGGRAQMRPIGSDLDALIAWLDTVRSHKVVVLASGDPLLFGIGKRIAESLPPASWQIVPGISSVQYLFSRIGLDMNDLYVTSSHGKQPDFGFSVQHAQGGHGDRSADWPAPDCRCPASARAQPHPLYRREPLLSR